MKNMNPDVMDFLARYGRHDFACDLHIAANLPGDVRCTCGFSQAQVKAQLQHDANAKLLKSMEIIVSMSSPGVEVNSPHRSLEVIHAESKLAIVRLNSAFDSLIALKSDDSGKDVAR